MFKNIFRKDLELNKKWWHRLFQILFIVGILFLIGKFYGDFFDKSGDFHKRIANIEDRLTDKVSKIEDLIQFGEKFNRYDPRGTEDSWNKDIYCSNRLDDIDNIKYIINETGIDNFNRLRKNKNVIDVESFSMLLRSTRVKCIITDNAEIDFLNPMREFDEFGFYEKNRLGYFKYQLVDIIITFIIYLIIIYIIYYKIILYIVYGNKK